MLQAIFGSKSKPKKPSVVSRWKDFSSTHNSLIQRQQAKRAPKWKSARQK